MKLIVGLGNPGEKYKDNRHNVGHVVVDELKTNNTPRDKSGKLKGVVIAKTDTFMNDSGSFVKSLMSKDPNILISELYVIHDDLDIALGSYKIQLGKAPKNHKGLESIDEALGTMDYWHVRVGIENRNNELGITNYARTPGEEYVLEDFTDEEVVKVEKTIRKLLIDLIHLISK